MALVRQVIVLAGLILYGGCLGKTNISTLKVSFKSVYIYNRQHINKVEFINIKIYEKNNNILFKHIFFHIMFK